MFWRSLLPLPSSLSLFPPQICIPHHQIFCLFQSKIYRLEDPSSSSSKGWIIKVGESKSMPLRFLDPFTNSPTRDTSSPRMLNLMNFRVVELIETYTLSFLPLPFPLQQRYKTEGADGASMPIHDVGKVVLFPWSVKSMVFVLYKDRKLGVSNIGDENWTIMDDGNKQYDDIILHKGQPYVVDKWGTILWIDCSSLKLVPYSPALYGFGKKKQLVECGGSLYVVDMYIVGEYDNPRGMYPEAVDIKVYKLDEEWGRWLDVKNLGDVLFVLGQDSNFSLSAQDYYGCQGNCIYFYFDGKVRDFSLETCWHKPSTTFWPCPTLFNSTSNSKYKGF